MGRTPCCEKVGLKRGPWTPVEDFKLISFIAKHGHDNWRALPKQAGLLRCGKSCRLRWTNYLQPGIKRGNFTPEEEETIIKLHGSLGNKWSKIASHLPGRTDNEIKNVWHTHLKKRLVPKDPQFSQNETHVSSISTASSTSSSSLPYGNNELQEGVGGQVHQQSGPINGFPKVNEMGIEEINKQDFLVEPVQNEVQPSIWNMLDGNGYNVKDNVGNRVLGNHMVSKQRGTLEEHKEFSSSSSYTNYSKSHVSYSNQTEGSRQEEQEVNKKDPVEEVIEIPFDPNLDVWNILDSSSSPFNEASVDEFQAQQHSTSGEQEEENRDSARWIRYLETELGLHLTYDEMKEIESDDTAEPLSPDLFIDGALSMDGIIDPVATYFKLQPTSTNYFGV